MNTKTSNTTTMNAPRTIPGLCYVQNPAPWWVPPGLEQTQGPNAKPPTYLPPFFGADREYGPEEGWQTPRTRRARRKMRRNTHRNDDVEDVYGFDDEAY